MNWPQYLLSLTYSLPEYEGLSTPLPKNLASTRADGDPAPSRELHRRRYVSTIARADWRSGRSGVGAELRMSDWPFQCATLAVHA
jgi:hypothetical protein